MKPITLAVLTGIAGTASVGILLWPVTGTSKAPAKQFATARSKSESQVRALRTNEARAWQPVAVAMASGDVAATRRAFSTYLASCPAAMPTLYNFRRPEVAKFFVAHGDRADAKAELDHVLGGTDHGKPDSLATEPDTVALWLQVATDATPSERESVLKNWATAYRAIGFSKPGALPELGPEALLEYVQGQRDLGNHLRYNEAAEHYRRATVLAPDSLVAAEGLADSLWRAGKKEEARQAAVRASKLMDNPNDRFAFLSSHGATKEYLAKLKP